MGFEATFYVESDKDIFMEEDNDSTRCPWIGNERDLDDVIIRYGHKSEDNNYWFSKSDMAKVINALLESVMNIYCAAVNAHYEMENVEEKELDNTTLHREYYVIGRLMNKKIYNEYRYSDVNALSVFTDDCEGERMKRLILGLIGLIIRAKDDEKIWYKRSY